MNVPPRPFNTRALRLPQSDFKCYNMAAAFEVPSFRTDPVQKAPSARLPSPLSTFDGQHSDRSAIDKPAIDKPAKRRRTSSPPVTKPDDRCKRICSSSHDIPGNAQDPVQHWISFGNWPPSYGDPFNEMSHASSPSKRRSSSMHHSSRIARLVQNGIHMKMSTALQPSSKAVCAELLKGDEQPEFLPCYSRDKIPDVLERAQQCNEPKIQRDITPWVVPSAENLRLTDRGIDESIGEEVQAEWSRCITMGSTKPKPDFTVGFLQQAFTSDEITKLDNYCSPERPFMMTPDIAFPFLICEAKSGFTGIELANLQNIHSASLAVKSIIELYRAAFQESQPQLFRGLSGRILVFSISHNNSQANLYGHFAKIEDDAGATTVQYFRYDITTYGLLMKEGAERFKSYNFVLNLYKQHAPQMLSLIKEAVASLPPPRQSTSLSFAASELTVDASDSQGDSQEGATRDGNMFVRPSESASALQRKELDFVKKLLEQQREESQSRERMMETQMEQQRLQMEQQRLQMEQQRLQMEHQREDALQQRTQMQKQLEQQGHIIELLQKNAKS